MIRPSSLAIGELCGLAPVLAERHKEAGLAADRGSDIHAEAARYVRSGGSWAPQLPAVRLLRDAWTVPEGADAEVPCVLSDPETGAEITRGTADVVFVRRAEGMVYVVDWKSGRPENVEQADENLQLAAYGIAAALAHNVDGYTVGLAFLSDDAPPDFRWATPVVGADMWKMLDRIKAIVARPPTPTVGPHCDSLCWRRHHCPAYLLPAHEGESALVPFTEPGGLTEGNALTAVRVVAAIKVALDRAEAQLKDFAREHPISDGSGKVWCGTTCAGRETADVKALKADGLTQYLKRGADYERFGWKRG